MKVTVAYDFRLLAYRNLYQILYSDRGFFSKDSNEKDREEDSLKFGKAMMASIWSDVSKFSINAQVEQVISVRDSIPWRNDIHNDSKLPYKGTRKKSKPFESQQFFDAMDRFTVNLEKICGIHTIKVDKLEADDIICYLSMVLNKSKRNCIIVTSDSDIYQTATTSNSGSTVVYNSGKNAKMFVIGEDFIPPPQDVTSVDIFNVGASAGSPIFDFVSQHDYVAIDQRKQLFEKLLCGDISDNIPGVGLLGVKTLKKASFNKIWNLNKLQTMMESNKSAINDYIKKLLEVNSDEIIELVRICAGVLGYFDAPTILKIEESIIRNIDLIYLHPIIHKKFGLVDNLKEVVTQLRSIETKKWRTIQKPFMDKSLFNDTELSPEKHYKR